MQASREPETDKMNQVRPGASATAHAPAPRRENWLDRLARSLAPVPVDHMPIVPRHLSAAQDLVRSHRAPPPCCTTAG